MYSKIIKIQNSYGDAFRLFLYRNEMSTTVLTAWIVRFDFLCIWGGADKLTDEYMSWEFDGCLREFFEKKFKDCWI